MKRILVAYETRGVRGRSGTPARVPRTERLAIARQPYPVARGLRDRLDDVQTGSRLRENFVDIRSSSSAVKTLRPVKAFAGWWEIMAVSNAG